MSSTPTPRGASTAGDPLTRKPTDEVEYTPVGVDVGLRQLVTVASADASPDAAVAVEGGRVRDTYTRFTEATHRVARRDAHAGEVLGDVVARFWRRFRWEFERAADAVLDEARRHPAPVVVLEDLCQEVQPLVACRCGDVRAATWIPAAVQAVVADRVVDAGLPVAYVDPKYTTRQCHSCGLLCVDEGETIVCTTADCPVDEVCRDASAAISIAQRGVGNA